MLTCYNPPRSNKIKILDDFDDLLEKLPNSSPIIICGDFNIDTLVNNLVSQKYTNIIESNGFDFLIENPTRITDSSATCIDHFIARDIDISMAKVLDEQNVTDHCPIVLEFLISTKDFEIHKIFRDTKFLEIDQNVSNYLFNLNNELIRLDDNPPLCINGAFNDFQSLFLKVTNDFAPIRSSAQKIKTLPNWFSNKLVNLRSKRNKLHKEWKLDIGNRAKLERFRCIRKQFENEVTTAKKNFYKFRFKSCIGESRKTFKLLNDLKGKVMRDNNPPSLTAEKTAINETNDQTANRFSTFFSKVGEVIKKTYQFVNQPCQRRFLSQCISIQLMRPK